MNRPFQTIPVLLAAMVLGSACGGESTSGPPPDVSSSSSLPEGEGAEAGRETASAETAEKAGEKSENDVDHAPEPGVEPSDGGGKSAAPAEPSDVPGANLRVGKLEADGIVAKDIACKTEGGGAMALLGAVLVTAWMTPQKKALDACGPAGTETRIVWKARGGKLTEVVAKGDGKTKSCVERALSGGKPVVEGQCAATLVYGK
jgi:hypothetical protein